MSDPPPDPAALSDEGGPRPGPRPTTGAPRWVKVSVIVVIVLIVVFAIVQLTGLGGSHGPGRHLSSGSPGDTVLLPDVAADADRGGGPTRLRVAL
ncbi:hypothetical protein [Pseudonocardia sp. GCM10023141]|uniref:hypothetical protein n=1 Tax=Pseudonocardia sp. GCM10023141 TaxID=3252653 RepID=UPI00360C0859